MVLKATRIALFSFVLGVMIIYIAELYKSIRGRFRGYLLSGEISPTSISYTAAFFSFDKREKHERTAASSASKKAKA